MTSFWLMGRMGSEQGIYKSQPLWKGTLSSFLLIFLIGWTLNVGGIILEQVDDGNIIRTKEQ